MNGFNVIYLKPMNKKENENEKKVVKKRKKYKKIV